VGQGYLPDINYLTSGVLYTTNGNTDMNKTIHIAGVIFIAVITFLIGYWFTYIAMSNAPQENTRRVISTVEAVCSYARTANSIEADEACRKAQDVSNTMWICENTCYVEENR
jgi:hypothetical protein